MAEVGDGDDDDGGASENASDDVTGGCDEL